MLPHSSRTLVMGILNVTPDSFSDGGTFLDHESAIAHGLRMRDEGADIVDVGGESTRPGAVRVSEAEEQDRILPVIEALSAHGITVSTDTMRASTALLAIKAGAKIINDVSGGLADPEMASTVADAGCGFIAMHWRGHSDRMQEKAQYADVVQEVCDELHERVSNLRAAGIRELVIDPGLGFAKEAEHNWALLAGIPRLQALGLPLLIGASRKRFLGPDVTPAEREAATVAVTALAAAAGVWAVRVHQVRENVEAVRVATAWSSR